MTDTEKAALCARIDELCAEVERGKAENAKLVDVLHEVEQEAIYAYNCLQQDCEAVVGGQTHFFNKWWHAECECDRLKSQNAKLRELVDELYPLADYGAMDASELDRAHDLMRDAGIEVPDGEF